MNTLFLFLLILFNVSQYQCEIPPCRTNCTIIEECWREALAYRSSELIEQLFSFSSLSVHVNTYQQYHTSEVNNGILFIDKAFESHILTESIDTNLSMNLFAQTKALIMDFCTNLTSSPIETVDELPPLICSLSTCSSDLVNFMVLFIISVLISSCILLICIMYSFQTHRQANFAKKILPPTSFVNPFPFNNTSFNLNSDRF